MYILEYLRFDFERLVNKSKYCRFKYPWKQRDNTTLKTSTFKRRSILRKITKTLKLINRSITN